MGLNQNEYAGAGACARPEPTADFTHLPPKHGTVGHLAEKYYRFDCPRTIFLTFAFFDPRAYSRGFNGFAVLRFFRAVRFAFLRSSLLSAVVFAMDS